MANAATATYSGRSIVWNRMKGNGTEAKNIGWGTGGGFTAAANPDVNLFAPATEARTAGTSALFTTTQLGDTYQVTGSITCAVGGKTITEVGLFDVTTLSPTTTVAATITTNAIVTWTLGSSAGFPSSGNYYGQVGNEVVLVTGGQGTTTITLTRAALGSTAGASYPVGTPFTLGGDGGAGSGGATSGQTATVGASQGGNIFIHADFGGIALNVNDSVNFTVRDQLT